MTSQAFTLPIYSTEDYTVFQRLDGNRILSTKQVKRLEKLIEQEPEFTKTDPLKVNEKMEIIDGQHRVEAFKNYEVKSGDAYPVYYMIIDGARLRDARNFNSGAKPWGPKDYALAYATEGNKHYQTFLKFAAEFQVGFHELATYLFGAQIKTSEFRAGNFEVRDEKGGREKLKNLMEVGPLFHNWPSRSFSLAFFNIVQSPKYDQARMVKQMTKYKSDLHSVPLRTSELTPALNMIYNLGQKDKVDLLTD